jgi:tRNA/tmRNA/rRNA uracil-C5-methylase (TrmA/RlmC/RlmD family)
LWQSRQVENVAPAIDDAKANASWNKIDNVDFVVGNVEDVVDSHFIEQYGIPDVIITTPKSGNARYCRQHTASNGMSKNRVYQL